jgi:hypothetical protein
MSFIKIPLTYEEDSYKINRELRDLIAMIDNFIELIVFSPRGSFTADEGFGFEYWNHEYTNLNYVNFNNEQTTVFINDSRQEVTKKECEESIKEGLKRYVPQLSSVEVMIELNPIYEGKIRKKKLSSKYSVSVNITGKLDDGLGTSTSYEKRLYFLIEPIVKQISI